jgi:hypothetical protein
MRHFALAVALCLSSIPLHTQMAAAPAKHKTLTAVEPVTPAAIKDLPVRKVVLYKNGVGYFEHSGNVNGNQRVAIDFTSSQLNDVLQSLTVLDQGGGHISGVNYNSTTPLAEQLKSLSLGMGEDPTATELFQALRGQPNHGTPDVHRKPHAAGGWRQRGKLCQPGDSREVLFDSDCR